MSISEDMNLLIESTYPVETLHEEMGSAVSNLTTMIESFGYRISALTVEVLIVEAELILHEDQTLPKYTYEGFKAAIDKVKSIYTKVKKHVTATAHTVAGNHYSRKAWSARRPELNSASNAALAYMHKDMPGFHKHIAKAETHWKKGAEHQAKAEKHFASAGKATTVGTHTTNPYSSIPSKLAKKPGSTSSKVKSLTFSRRKLTS